MGRESSRSHLLLLRRMQTRLRGRITNSDKPSQKRGPSKRLQPLHLDLHLIPRSKRMMENEQLREEVDRLSGELYHVKAEHTKLLQNASHLEKENDSLRQHLAVAFAAYQAFSGGISSPPTSSGDTGKERSAPYPHDSPNGKPPSAT